MKAWIGAALLLGAVTAHAQQTVFMPIVIEVSGSGAVSGTNFRDGALMAIDEINAKGGFFGPHNLHENRPGAFQSSRLIFATYYNAGVRVYDIADQARPKEIAFYVPPNPVKMVDPRPNRPQVLQTADCYVDRNGLMYLTDQNAGLNILQFEGP